MDWLYPLSGFVVGAVVGLTGMGGGSLMTPILILLFGVNPLTAVGTDLMYAALTKAVGTLIHAKKGHVAWGLAGVLAIGSVPAAGITIWALALLPKQSPTTAAFISISIGASLIIAAIAIFFRRRIRGYALARADDPARVKYAGSITVVFGALLGVLVSLCSVGAGALGVAVLFSCTLDCHLYAWWVRTWPTLCPLLWSRASATGSSAVLTGRLWAHCLSVHFRASTSEATFRPVCPIVSYSPC
jgi:uncharacterized protein